MRSLIPMLVLMGCGSPEDSSESSAPDDTDTDTDTTPPPGVDTSYADEGVLRIPVAHSTDIAMASVRTADGGVVVAGSTGATVHTAEGLLARFDSQGNLDTAFGTDGFASIVYGTQLRLTSIVELDDGSLVAAGVAYSLSHGMRSVVVRTSAAGELDPTWGDGGVLEWPGSSGRCYLTRTASQIQALCPGPGDTMLRALTFGGALDTSFGDGGEVTVGRDEPRALLAMDDGRFLTLLEGSTESFVAVRQSDGSPDPGFGPAELDLAGRALAIDRASGRIAVGGEGDSSGEVWVLQATGAVDTTFGTDGRATVDTQYDEVCAVQWLGDGGLLVQDGQVETTSTFMRDLHRLDATGLEVPFDMSPYQAFRVGRFGSLSVVGSEVELVASFERLDSDALTDPLGIGVARIDLDGTPAAFGTDGIGQAESGRSSELLWELVRDPDGSAVGVGAARVDGLITRIEADGAVADWGTYGTVISYFVNFPPASVDSARRIVTKNISGWPQRWTPSGELDTAFGPSGTAQAFVDAAFDYQFVRAVHTDSADRVVSGGMSQSGVPMISRVTPEGQVDTTFGVDGVVELSVAGSTPIVVSVGNDGDGGYAVVGLVDLESFFTRVGEDGSVAGVTRLPVELERPVVLIRPGGGWLVGGLQRFCVGSECGLTVVGLHSSGELDADFGVGGVATVAIDPEAWADFGVADDGHILVAGTLEIEGTPRFTVWGLTPDGAPDTSFGDEGVLQMPRPGGAAALLEDGDGWLVGGWLHYDDGGMEPAVVRLGG